MPRCYNLCKLVNHYIYIRLRNQYFNRPDCQSVGTKWRVTACRGLMNAWASGHSDPPSSWSICELGVCPWVMSASCILFRYYTPQRASECNCGVKCTVLSEQDCIVDRLLCCLLILFYAVCLHCPIALQLCRTRARCPCANESLARSFPCRQRDSSLFLVLFL